MRTRNNADRRQEIGTVGDIFYDKSVFVIGDMVIIKELCKIFRLFTGHGVAADSTVL